MEIWGCFHTKKIVGHISELARSELNAKCRDTNGDSYWKSTSYSEVHKVLKCWTHRRGAIFFSASTIIKTRFTQGATVSKPL